MMPPRKPRPISVSIAGPDKDGYYSAKLTVGVKPNGKLDRRGRKSRDYAEVERKIRDLEDEIAELGRVAKPGKAPTVEGWLRRWQTEVVRNLRYATRKGTYRWAVNHYLIPRLGAHRLDKLEAHHVDNMYRDLEDSGKLKPASIHTIHSVLHAALNVAERRGLLRHNPMPAVRTPEEPVEEVTPLYVEEVKAITQVCLKRRNGTRWLVGLALGPRQGEALALPWMQPVKSTRDKPIGLNPKTGEMAIRRKAQRRTWQHGCTDPARCARWKHGCRHPTTCPFPAWECPRKTERCRTAPCRSWDHGCGGTCGKGKAWACPQRTAVKCRRHHRDCPRPCPAGCTKHASTCPQRTGGGIVIDDDPKSRAGKRRTYLPQELLPLIQAHAAAQKRERLAAGTAWHDNNLVWCQPNGAPIDPRRDWADWKDILREAGVRDARVHDGRHTAATILLLLGVDRGVVMDIMGWSDERMVKRYQHVVDELRQEAAARVGGLLFGANVIGGVIGGVS